MMEKSTVEGFYIKRSTPRNIAHTYHQEWRDSDAACRGSSLLTKVEETRLDLGSCKGTRTEGMKSSRGVRGLSAGNNLLAPTKGERKVTSNPEADTWGKKDYKKMASRGS